MNDRVSAVDAFESEQITNLIQGQKFAIIFRRPAQQAKKVDEGLGQKARIAIGGHADDRPMFPLGQFGAIGCNEQGEMRELRRRAAETLKDEKVLESVAQVILAADDVADAEIGIVEARGEVIRGHAVRAEKREIFYLVGRLGLFAVDGIREVQHPAFTAGHAIAQRERLARCGATVRLFTGQLAHSGVEEPRALRTRSFACE